MVKKIVAWFFILVGVAALFFAGSALVLILAPGTEIFGIRYMNSGMSEYTYKDNISHFTGDIYIETEAVPITVEYSVDASYYIYYCQNFVGFTRSEHEKASLDANLITNEETGKEDLVIKANEMVKWLYAQDLGADYEFKLRLPIQAANKSLHIKSPSSSVKIDTTGLGNVAMKNFDVVSEGDFTLKGKIYADTFKLHTNKTININDNIDCLDLDLKSSGGNINISKAIRNIKAETSVGDIKFLTCQNLDAKTDSGDVKSYNAGLTSVAGYAKIQTKSGFIELGNVSFDTTLEAEKRKLEIKSNSGEINVSLANDVVITSERGKVLIGEANKLVINANVGSVVVKTVHESAIINGRNGSVTMGENGTIKNVEVVTTSGKIDVQNTTGQVNLKSTSNAVTYKNLTSENITIHSAKDLNAHGLRGTVNIYTNGDANISFAQVSGDVNIETGGKTDNVNIDATCQDYSTVNYKIESTKGAKAKVFAGESLLVEKTKIESTMVEGQKTINVKTSYAEVVLKLSA